jgi:hypothetical protein
MLSIVNHLRSSRTHIRLSYMIGSTLVNFWPYILGNVLTSFVPKAVSVLSLLCLESL